MKKTLYAIIIIIAATLSSCTRNNGDIGDLFGTWRLESLKVGDIEQPLQTGDVRVYTWAFQSHIIYIQTIFDHDDYKRARGTWTMDEENLILDFGHTDIDGSNNYTPPEALHLNADGKTYLRIVEYTSDRLHLIQVLDGAPPYEYYLKKAY